MNIKNLGKGFLEAGVVVSTFLIGFFWWKSLSEKILKKGKKDKKDDRGDGRVENILKEESKDV